MQVLVELVRGGGQVVSVLTLYSVDPSYNPAEVYNLICNLFEKYENKHKKRPGIEHLIFFDWTAYIDILVN